jgi:hypothetical protein
MERKAQSETELPSHSERWRFARKFRRRPGAGRPADSLSRVPIISSALDFPQGVKQFALA